MKRSHLFTLLLLMLSFATFVSAQTPGTVEAACDGISRAMGPDEEMEDCVSELTELGRMCPGASETMFSCLAASEGASALEECINPCMAVIMGSMANTDDPLASRDPQDPLREAGRPWTGASDPLVTMVVFSDFECPFCARGASTFRDLLAAYPDTLRIVYKQFPLAFHSHAQLTAQASLAVAAQERTAFWQFHDLVFANQGALARADLEGYANTLELDMDLFRSALDDGRYAALVEEDIADGEFFGVRGTPSALINGQLVAGAQPIDAFRAVIDAELAEVNALVEAGATRRDAYLQRVTANFSLPAPPAPARRAPEPPAAAAPMIIDTTGAAAAGPADAPVEIVVFADFECPYCQRFYETLTAVTATYPTQVRTVSMQFPLPMHTHAMLASEAALAAGAQGRYWEMHRALYSAGRDLSLEHIMQLANALELDLEMFRTALDTHAFRAIAEAQTAEGTRVGVTGTPSWFVNGVMYSGARPEADVRQAIETALSAEPGGE